MMSAASRKRTLPWLSSWIPSLQSNLLAGVEIMMMDSHEWLKSRSCMLNFSAVVASALVPCAMCLVSCLFGQRVIVVCHRVSMLLEFGCLGVCLSLPSLSLSFNLTLSLSLLLFLLLLYTHPPHTHTTYTLYHSHSVNFFFSRLF
eukprot:m.9905 g.9905  ORF g.9905 m.9905 type:complete len:145 (-) comp5859_c0_seq1:157-591(-)